MLRIPVANEYTAIPFVVHIPEGSKSVNMPKFGMGRVLCHPDVCREWYVTAVVAGRRIFVALGYAVESRKWWLRHWVAANG